MALFRCLRPRSKQGPLALAIVAALLFSILWPAQASHAHDTAPLSIAAGAGADCASSLDAAMLDHDRAPHEMPCGALAASADCCAPCVTTLVSHGLAPAAPPRDQPADAIEQAPTDHSIPPRLKPPRFAA